MTDIPALLDIAKDAALKAGEGIMEVYHSGEFNIEMKACDSPLTKADKTAHHILRASLSKTGIPVLSEEGADIDFKVRMTWEYFWLVDPLDGTKEFISKNGEFTVNIALVHQHAPVAGVVFAPARDCMYAGSRETGVYKTQNNQVIVFDPLQQRKSFEDILALEEISIVASRSHMSTETNEFISRFRHVHLQSMGSSLKFMLLIENIAQVYPRLGTTMEWDTAAAHAILNALNRGVYQADLQSELIYNKADLHNPYFIAF